MRKGLKSFCLAIAGLLSVFALVSCGEEAHTHTYETKHDATSHWEECACGDKKEAVAHSYGTEWVNDTTYHWHECACGAKTEEIPHNFGDWVITVEPTLESTGTRTKTCADCGRVKSESIDKLQPEKDGTTEPTAVYATVPEDWAICNIYFWTDGADSFVSWPGVEMTLVDEATCLWGYILPAGVENVIFNNGSAQTIDIVYQKTGNLYNVVPGEGNFDYELDTYTPEDDDPELNGYTPKDPDAVEDYTIYVQLPANWANPNIYFWEGDKKPEAWPGAALEVVDAENNVYSYLIDTAVTTVIFNNGTVQTVNLSIVEGANAFIVEDEATGSEGKFNATPMIYDAESGDFAELPKDYTMYVQVPTSWTTVNVYYWGVDDAPGWPGNAMEVVDAEKGIYSYVISEEVKTVIFNNGEVQTEDLAVVLGNNAFVLAAEVNAGGKYDATAKVYNAESGEFEESEVEVTIPELYVVGTITNWGFVDANKLVIGEDGKATIVIELTVDDKFKVSTTTWAPAFGWGKFVDNTDGALADALADGNIKVTKAGTYTIVVEIVDNALVCTIDVEVAEVQPEVTIPELYLKGSMNEWSDNADYKLVIGEDGKASLVVDLAVGDVFKVATTNWSPEYGWNQFVDNTEGALVADGSNIKVATAGKYTIVVEIVDNALVCTISVELPAAPEVIEKYQIRALSVKDEGDSSLIVWNTAGDVLASFGAPSSFKLSNGWRLYIVVDGDGKIAYMCNGPVGGYGNVVESSYIRHSDYAQYANNPAFKNIGTESYNEYGSLPFDLVIPEGGFAICAHNDGATSSNDLVRFILGLEVCDANINTNSKNVDNIRLVYDAQNRLINVFNGEIEEVPAEGVYYEVYNNLGKLTAQGTVEAVEGVATITANICQWGSVVLFNNGVRVSSTGLTISGDGWLDGGWKGAGHHCLYHDGDSVRFISAYGPTADFILAYNAEANTLSIDNSLIIPVPELFLKGTVNDWTDNNAYKLVVADGKATLGVYLEAGVEFKIANSNWTYEFNGSEVIVADGVVTGDGNMTTVAAGYYTFVVEGLGDQVTATCTLTFEAPATFEEDVMIKVTDCTRKFEGVKGVWNGLFIDATSGKWAPNNSSWFQVNKDTVIKLNVAEGAVVSVISYTPDTFTVEVEGTVCTITALANDYLSTIAVSYPVVYDEEATINVVECTYHVEGSKASWRGLEIDATNGKWALNSTKDWIQVNKDTVIKLNVAEGAIVSVVSHTADTFTVVVEGTVCTITAVANDYLKTITVTYPMSVGDVLASAVGTKVEFTAAVLRIDTAWDTGYKNLCCTVIGLDGNTIYCYRLGTNVSVGDVVTISGTVGEYSGKQIGQGGTAVVVTEVSDADKAAYAKLIVSAPAKVEKTLELTASLCGATITWASNSEAIVIENGVATVNQTDADQAVKLTATIVAGEVTLTKEIDVVVLPASDVELVATITFDNTENRTEFTTEKQVWVENGVTCTNEKASSSTNVADYSGIVRLYAGSTIKISYTSEFSKLVITCENASRATALVDSIGSAASADGAVVTIVFPVAITETPVISLTAQTRIDKIEVYA